MPGISKEIGRSSCGQISGYSLIMLGGASREVNIHCKKSF